jgi:hypothetical protein
MPDWSGLGKTLILAGAFVVLVGVLVVLVGKLSDWGNGFGGFGWLGKLPGDISIKRDTFSFYAPLTTSVLISIAGSLLFFLLSSLWRR